MRVHHWIASGTIALLAAGCATTPPATPQAAATPAPAAQPAAAPAKAAGPDSLQVLFPTASADLSPAADGVIDHAARLFREGNPVVMTIAGHSDPTGDELPNLLLSARRAATVKQALIARGIPAKRLDLVALGTSDPASTSDPKAADNRRVVITWR